MRRPSTQPTAQRIIARRFADILILESIADGLCDIGVTNHYHLARKLEKDPQFQDTFLVADNHEYPADPDVAPEPLITERFGTDFGRVDLDAAAFGSLNPEAVRLMDEADHR